MTVSIVGAAGVVGAVLTVGVPYIRVGLVLMLPASMPPNAPIYGTRQVTVFQVVPTSLLLDFLAPVMLRDNASWRNSRNSN